MPFWPLCFTHHAPKTRTPTAREGGWADRLRCQVQQRRGINLENIPAQGDINVDDRVRDSSPREEKAHQQHPA
jgi:hypothetical protein